MTISAVFYSDQIIPENDRIDRRLLEMMAGRGRQIGYIPSGPDPEHRFFGSRQAYYARHDLELMAPYDLDAEHGPLDLDDLLACDAIHLSGGDTTAFLKRLRRSGMIDVLRRWAASGGILIGTSAGAILMTPTIAVDALFSGRRPEEVQDGAALDLLPFEFFPHLHAKQSYLPDLLRYGARIPWPIIACPDGDGVVVAKGRVHCIGNPLWLSGGKISHMADVALSDLLRAH